MKDRVRPAATPIAQNSNDVGYCAIFMHEIGGE